jgi:phosphate-induced protein 1
MRTTVVLFSLTLLAGCSNVDPGVGDSDEAITGELLPTGKGYLTRNANAQANAGGGGGTKTGANGINYHGGPVMLGTVNIYYIWYGNWAGNSATTILPDLVGDLNGSGYEHINATYFDGSNNHVSGNLALAGQTTVTAYLGTSLSDNQIFQVVTDTLSAGKLPSDSTAIYFVLTSADVTASSGFCTQYCGWHTHGAYSGKDIKYAFVGNPDRCPTSCAEQTTGPNGNAGADGMASIIAHESEEAISDPDLNAWYDRRGNENADKCAWTFGTESTASNGSKYNFSGKRQWLIQQNWVNAGGGFCAMSY